MKIATNYVFWGLCREAMSFYCEALGFKIEKCTVYGDCEDLGMPLKPEQKDLIHSAELLHPSGCRIFMCDSITLLFSQDPVGEINAGHISQRGCRAGSSFEVCDLSEEEITSLYNRFVENKSIVHIPLSAKNNHKLYASVMDRFNLNWNFTCE